MKNCLSRIIAGIMALLIAFPIQTASAEPETIWAFQGDVAFFRENEKVGLINREGEILAPAIYDNGSVFNDHGFARVYLNDKIGCINQQGELVIPLTRCDFIGASITTGVATYYVGGVWDRQYGFYTLDGHPIGTKTWNDTDGFIFGSAFVQEDKRWNLMDLQGNLLSDIWWDKATANRYDGGGTVKKGNKVYQINAQGAILREEQVDKDGTKRLLALYTPNGESIDFSPWEDMKVFYEDIWAVRQNGLWGLIDSNGNVIQEPIWRSITSVQEGNISRPQNAGMFEVDVPDSEGETAIGWLDSEGHVLVAAEWDWFDIMTETRYLARKGKRGSGYGVIFNEKGEIVAEVPDWFQQWFVQGGNIYYRNETKNGGEWGYMSPEGEILCVISEKEYDYYNPYEVATFGDGMQIVEKKDKRGKRDMLGYMDMNGRFIGSKEWKDCNVFSNGLAFVLVEGGFIIIDKNGDQVGQTELWDEIGDVVKSNRFDILGNQRIALVRRNGKSAYINERGELICGFQ
ncbi:hypothetical protein FACS1894196_2450 [Clostridia bacterium]|nr:hypothetical protein FACS1894196_2450 [Clostridia bacterium]